MVASGVSSTISVFKASSVIDPCMTLAMFMDWWRYEPNKANRISNYVPKCQYRRYMHVGHQLCVNVCSIWVLIMNVEVEGNAKTKILSFCMVCLRYEPNKANRISNYAPKCQYRRYMHVGHPSMCMAFLIWVLIMNVEVEGNAKTIPRFWVCSWFVYDMNQIKLTE